MRRRRSKSWGVALSMRTRLVGCVFMITELLLLAASVSVALSRLLEGQQQVAPN